MDRDWHELVSQPQYKVKLEEGIPIIARDGVELFADIYHPDAEGKFPALLSLSPYGKDIQKLPVPERPSDFFRGTGGIESGIPEYFVSRGYVHVRADHGGIGRSGRGYCHFGQKQQEDGYNIVEWIAKQPWCNGNVGMLGHSWFAVNQYLVAAQNPPHLKAIFPHSGYTDEYRHFAYHGGIFDWGFYHHLWRLIVTRTTEPMSKTEFSSVQLERMLEDLRNNEDIKGVPYLYMLTIAPEKNPLMLDLLLHPYDGPFYWERSAYTKFDKIKIPCYFLASWQEWAAHLPGAFSAYLGVNAPKKLLITTGLASRPWHEEYDIVLRWYDHWLKGIDTGIMDEPPIRIFVQGINQWRYENEWPLARTKWTKFYLRRGGRLADMPPWTNESPDRDSFVNKPWLRDGEEIPCIKYTTDPLTEDVEITGPIALNFYASLSTEDANWFVYIKDIDVDGSERVVSKGWLKASHREIDDAKSKPYQPFHRHTKSIPVEPEKIYEYAIDIRETSNVFRAGHRLQLVIRGQDSPWDDQFMIFHLCNMRETQHTIYHTAECPSYLLLPIIPK